MAGWKEQGVIGVVRRERRVLTTLALALSALCGLVAFAVVAAPAQAAVSRAFSIRYQNNQHGDILLRGNSLLTCPPSAACTTAINGTATGGALNNNNYAMQFADIDADASTHSSSSADLTLPPSSTVLWAGLYWSAYTGSGGGTTRTAPPAGTASTRLLLKAPGDSAYRTITASNTDTNGAVNGAPYVSFADVTSVVQNAGSGTYIGADIYAATGPDSYGAWSLVTVVKAASFPKRNLTVFDGFGTVQNSPGDTTIDIGLSGFETPPMGSVDVRLGAVSFEGDAGNTGDAMQVIPPAGSGVPTTTLTDAQNPVNNYFNSTISDGGTAVTGRVPDGNAFGFDADVYSSSVLLGNSATSATLRLTTGGETYFPAVATFTANIYAPDVTINQAATVVDVDSDGQIRPGDRINYTVTVTNVGDDESDNTVLTSPIPAGTSYLPGSLKIAGSGRTDAPDSDAANVSGSNLVFRLGTGAGGSGGSGGVLLPTASTTYTYSVLIAGPFPSAGGAVTAASSATYDNPSAIHFTSDSNTVSTPIGAATADLAVAHVADPQVVQRSGSRSVTWTVTVTNQGPDTETAPTLTQALPSGVTSVANDASCTGTTVLSCALSALASGQSRTVTFTGLLPSGAADPSTATASVGGAGTDPHTGNNTASASVGVNLPPTATDDAASLSSSSLSIDVNVAANDSDPDGDPLTISNPGTPAHGTVTVVNGRIRYTLTDFHFTGTDSFPYTICDGRGGCTTANLVIAVSAHTVSDLRVSQVVAPAVVQRNGTRTVTWTVQVTNNGPDDEPSPTLSEQLPAGTTGITANGASCTTASVTATCPLPALAGGATRTVTFTATLAADAPDPSAGIASVTGTQLDPDTANNTETVSVPVNSAPHARPDNAVLSKAHTSVTVDVAGNDTDADGDELTVTAVTTPGHGTASIVHGKLVYHLTDPAFDGDDTFIYTVCDGRGACDSTTVTVAVANHGHPPVAKDDSMKTPIGTPVVVLPLVNDTDADGDTLAIHRIVSRPSHGAAVISGTRIVYTPDDRYAGKDELTYETCDPSGLCDRATISLKVTSRPPVANTDRDTVHPGDTVVVEVLKNDEDPDGDTLGHVTIVQQPKYGRVTVDSDGKVHYTAPDSGVPDGKVSFRYRTCDSSGACAVGSVVLAVNGAPDGSTGSHSSGSSASSGGPLAFTGADVGRLAAIALMLTLLGMAAIGASRRRSRPVLSWRSYGTADRYDSRPPDH